jgi:hypothetical protein
MNAKIFSNKIEERQDGEEGVERGCNNFHGRTLNTAGMCCTQYLCGSSGPREKKWWWKGFFDYFVNVQMID